ncbi:MAG: transaldolase family protein [Cyanobium sp.]
MALRFLIDSADAQDWEDLWSLGLFHRITTNPSLLRRAGLPCSMETFEQLVDRALHLGCQELHLQAWGATADELFSRAQALLDLAPAQILIKLPLTEGGLRTAALLLARDVRVTLTACYGPSQVLAAAGVGATYVAPYLGRISDSGADGCAEVSKMQRCLDGVGATTRLLVASLRSVEEILTLAPEGIDTYTLSPRLAK